MEQGSDDAGSATSILLYDRDGRVIGRDRDAVRFERRPAAAARRAEPGLRVPRLDGHGPEAEGGASGRAGGVPPAARGTAADARPSYVPGEILAVDPGGEVLRRARILGYTPVESVDLERLGFGVIRLRTPGSATTPEALDLFRRTFPGTGADFNALIDPSVLPGVTEAAWTVGWRDASPACGTGLKIGMIDTPVDVSHIALRRSRIISRRFVRPGRREASAAHGTAIAALLVGDPQVPGLGGLLPGATLLAASIFEERGEGGSIGNLLSFLMALDWMIEQKVTVLNLSLETVENAILSRAVERARTRGVLMAAAAGNGGADAQPAWPAAHPGVLAVTAVSVELLPFRYANRGAYIDFSAPGVQLWTAVPGGGGKFQSGTSLAVPFVTAIAALEIASGLEPDPAAIRAALIPGVMDLGDPGKDDVYGWGLVRFKPGC